MTKIIWMSDPHFVANKDVLGFDPKKRLKAAITHANDHYQDSDFCIISGDLVNRGTQIDYDGFKTCIDTLVVPYFLMAGNHDDRDILRSIFPMPENCMDNFIQYSIQAAEGLVICLDTQKVGSDAGEFCSERMQWLDETLKAAGNTPVFIFMHHPPMPLGLPMQDADMMENGERFLDHIEKIQNVKHLFIGHVHRPICGTIRNIPFATMRSVLYQAPPPKPNWNWEGFKPASEAPNFGILTFEKSQTNLQFIQFANGEQKL